MTDAHTYVDTSSAERNPGRPFRSIDVRIAECASHQLGLVTWHQLVDAGIGRASIHRRVHDGRLHRVRPGVYSLVPLNAISHDSWMLAVTLSCGPGTVVSHECAAHDWNIWRRWRHAPPPNIDVITTRDHRPMVGVTMHRLGPLADIDVCCRGGKPITDLPRTIIDLGSVITPFQLTNVIHEAHHWHRPSGKSIEIALMRAGHQRGVATVRRALAMYDAGSAGTRSMLEDAFLIFILAAGVVEPWVGRHVLADGVQLEVDFCWLRERVIVEVDGSPHLRGNTITTDRGRDELLRRAGFTVIRIGPASARRPPREVLAQLPHRSGRQQFR